MPTPDSITTAGRRVRGWRPAAVAAAVVVVYANSLGGMFLFDDLPGIYIPEVMHPWPPGWVLTNTRPVTTATFALNYAAGELDVWGYHAVNATIHAAAALILYGLVRRTLELPQYQTRYPGIAPNLALAAAALWAVHPLNTQAVSYIVQRMESLMGLFYLLSLYALLRGATAAERRAGGWYALGVLASALSMGSKQVGVTIPVVALLYDRCFLAGSFRGALGRRWPVYLGLLATVAVLIPSFVGLIPGTPSSGTAGGPGEASAGFALRNISAAEYARSQPGVILHYLRLAVWPRPLCLDYGWEIAHGPAEVLLPSLVVGGLLLASVVALRRRPGVGFLGTTFFLILAPTSSILPIADLAFEHRMYLSLACLVVLAVVAGDAVFRRWVAPDWVGPGLAAAVFVLFSALTIARNEDYRTDVDMWKDVIAKRPNNTRAFYNLGTLLFNIGEWNDAVPYLETADRLAGRWPMLGVDLKGANFNLGTILRQQGRYPEAVDRYRAALKAAPGHPEVLCGIAGVSVDLGQLDKAADEYRAVLAAHPGYPTALRGLAKQLARRGDYAGAAGYYEQTLAADPNDAAANTGLGIALRRLGRYHEAIPRHRAAVAAAPNDPGNANHLGLTLLMAGRPAEAADVFRAAVGMTPGDARFHAHLALALDDAGRPEDAEREYRAASDLSPDWPTRAGQAAWELATSPDPGGRHGPEAIILAREADRATRHENPTALDALAAGFAAVGRFPEAAATAKQAAAAAEARDLRDLADQVRGRAALYQAGRPYVRPNPAAN